jgi:hypothetical protein
MGTRRSLRRDFGGESEPLRLENTFTWDENAEAERHSVVRPRENKTRQVSPDTKVCGRIAAVIEA